MHLDGEREETSSVAFETLAHGENGEQELPFVIHVDVKTRELQPRHHGDIEGVGGRAVLGGVAGGLGILLRVGFIAFQKLRVILREVRPDARKVLVFLIENGVHRVHIVIDAQTVFGQARPKLGHIVDGFGEQPNHGGVQFLPFEIGDVDVDNGRIGTDHFVYEMLVELLTFPIFYVDQFECHAVTSVIS